MNSAGLEKKLDSFGKTIIWSCLSEIRDYNDFENMYRILKKFLDENWVWLSGIDRTSINVVLTRHIHSYFHKYGNPTKRPSIMIEHPISFGINDSLREELFDFVVGNESEYIDDLSQLYSSGHNVE